MRIDYFEMNFTFIGQFDYFSTEMLIKVGETLRKIYTGWSIAQGI